ncbi:HTH-type transcriptional activator RhaS [Pontiella desulfatans]|uniref:HTH-type transcriptional activator RhaS n=1 Tax=Pontiella desulfatans TaxID=2750659 RepID=A0A6C2TZ74_PONDE|nr:AraC family transcriptional regulator [Pontiella desulfatans]VGO12764.1 HTH-type transcriptional activator RhaS [Pontiella desulfatans]
MNQVDEIISYGYIENKLMYPHKNPGMEMVLVEQGSLEWAVEGVPEMLKPGTFFFTLPWQAHGSMHIREPRNKIYYILFELQKTSRRPLEQIRMCDRFGFSGEEQKLLSDAFVTAQRHAWPATGLVKQTFPELMHRLDSGNAVDLHIAVSLLRTLLLELANTINSSSGPNARFSATALKVDSFLKTLGDRLEDEWTLDEMAETCGIKRTYFARITRELTGYPPMQYLNRIRFERACSLLRKTNLPITEIGFQCGYRTSQYFAETFRKYARMTPTEYRSSLGVLDAIMQSNWSHPESRTVSDERERSSRIK